MNIEQQMSHMTTRLVVHKASGQHYGTGFFLGYDLGNGSSAIFCVTNRHVLHNAVVCMMSITTADANGRPQYGETVQFTIEDIASATIFHPDPSVDLAAFPVAGIMNEMVEQGFRPFFKAIGRKDLPQADTYETLGIADDVVMVGYPNGLFDEVNNLPILRRGITATSPALKFNGKKEFVIDCACFPGSSGSPVFLHQPTGYRDHATGSFVIGSGRTVLIGILFAGPQVTVNGELVPKPIPTVSQIGVQSMAMMHLGYCIRATEVEFLDAVVGRNQSHSQIA